ncbi:MAG: O-antigen ligase family protein [Aquaticitalea sp.]
MCNFLPVLYLIAISYLKSDKIIKDRFLSLKWTIVYTSYLLLFGLITLTYTMSVFVEEILPLILFLLLILIKPVQKIDYDYLLKFFRYAFIACIVIYLSPHFESQFRTLFGQAYIYKEAVNPNPFYVNRGKIPRNMGFVFDFRIMGQLSVIYLLILHYTKKSTKYFDVVLLIAVAILTFSRGPIVLLVLVLFAMYGPQKIRVTKRLVVISGIFLLMLISVVIYSVNNPTISKYVSTFNPFSEKSAISQRGMFVEYSLNKFYKNPLGNGIGSLSSPKAENVIFAGYTNFHKENPDPVYYHRVTDAYMAMSLAEKGIIGFILMMLSVIEIFYTNKNRISLLFLLGFLINLLGTDIPKQGFFYFVLIIIYFEISQLNFRDEKILLIEKT